MINGNELETFNIHDVLIEQSQMMIEFMSSVDTEHCKTFHVKSALLIYLLSETEIWSLNENNDTINMNVADPILSDYEYYPELFIVDSDFCTKK